jgi:hypothetical protein
MDSTHYGLGFSGGVGGFKGPDGGDVGGVDEPRTSIGGLGSFGGGSGGRLFLMMQNV